MAALGAAGLAFVTLLMAAVSFDGLAESFWWLARIGINPLEFPGRSAVMLANSLGLVGGLGAGRRARSWARWRWAAARPACRGGGC